MFVQLFIQKIKIITININKIIVKKKWFAVKILNFVKKNISTFYIAFRIISILDTLK